MHLNFGNALLLLKRFDLALSSYAQAITLEPNYAEAHYAHGHALIELKQFDAAVISYDQTIVLKPGFAEAYFSRGNILTALKKLNAAVASYDQAIALNPQHAEAYYNRGLALKQLKQFDSALASYGMAIALKPDFAEAHLNHGSALSALKQFKAAVASYDQALALKPDFAEAYFNRGNALKELKQLEAAVASYDRALALKPDFAEVYINRGSALQERKQFDDAVASYKQTMELKPNQEYLLGALLHAKMQMCDWSSNSDDLAEVLEKIVAGHHIIDAWPVLALSASPAIQCKAAELSVRHKFPVNLALGPQIKRQQSGKIRIGYFSPDYRDHPVAHLIAELIELHDRTQFEIIAFSFGPDNNDKMHQRLSAAFDKFIDVRHLSDQEVAVLSRKLEVDIAVDLAGFTADSRPGIFSYRAAPLQVNYIGHPGTMGAEYIDYIIADRVLIPEGAQQHYGEMIAYLPCFQPNDTRREISDKIFTRQDLGLPELGFVFCCLNNSYKIMPTMFDCWMRILHAVEGSILCLLMDTPQVSSNLRKEAAIRGIDPQRLVFMPRLAKPEYLARYKVIDLFIDTLPYNAGTTASDALWAGLPVLTASGEAFASRMAASLLYTLNLPELVTHSLDAYEALAIELASAPEKLQAIKFKLAQNRLTTPLFDTERYTQHIELAYRQMHERYHAGLPVEHIYVHG